MWLNFVCLWVVIIVLQLFRRQQRIVGAECDESDISCQDYTLIIKNINFDFETFDYDEDLKNFLKHKLWACQDPKRQAEIVEVTLMYRLDELYNLRSEKMSVIGEKQQALDHKHTHGYLPDNISDIDQFDRRINDINQRIKQLQESYYEGRGREFISKYFCGVSFVTFATEQEREDIQQLYTNRIFGKKKLVYHE